MPVIRLNFPDGSEIEADAEELWRLTDELVAADGEVAHAVAAAAELRLALKSMGGAGEVDLDEHQANAVHAIAR
jgi:hypothetical protein